MKQISRGIFILLIVMTATVFSHSVHATCSQILASDDAIISTLKELYNSRVISERDLFEIRDGQNPFNGHYTSQATHYLDVINAILDTLAKNPEARSRVDNFLAQMTSESQSREMQVADTEQLFLPMTMSNIPRGKFRIGSRFWEFGRDKQDKRHKVTLTKDFRVANFPVTQWQYAMVMRDLPEPNPSEFKVGPNTKTVRIDGRDIVMQPDNPVETVSWFDAQEFIKRVNEWSKTDNPLIYEIIANHTPFAKVRLLTNAEWEYIARNLGKWKKTFPGVFVPVKNPYPVGLTITNLNEFAWHIENSDKSTHPVGELSPFMINGSAVYDLLGNVQEWVEDGHASYTSCAEVDPKGASNNAKRTVRGCGFYGRDGDFCCATRHPLQPESRHYELGFRIAEDPL